MQTKLPINEIRVEDRQRQDLGDISGLAKSLQRYGLIQPIVISQDKRLLAGGRRLTAATALGWTEIPVVYKETLSEDQAFEIELEENVRRKDMSWQERCLTIAKIHRLKKARRTADHETWGMQETGELLGISKTHTYYNLTIASHLLADEKKEGPFWKAESMYEAWQIHLKQEEDADLKELATRHHEAITMVPINIEDTQIEQADIDVGWSELDEAKEKYLANPMNDPAKWEEYWAEKQARSIPPVPLSRMLFRGDCIDFMYANKATFDAIITDIPYGNDMDNLDTISNIDSVKAEHDVEYVRDVLMPRFFPAAYHTLKDMAYLATWCDIELWQHMYDLAVKAGFKVQRWPITWVKTHTCGNNSAQFNFTKTTEIAMVMRKGNATLVRNQPTSVIVAANDELCDAIRHPFAKPFKVWEFLIDALTIQGHVVLEPFAGGGSGVVSLLRKGRVPFACEINDVHYNELLENVKQLHYLKLNPNARFC